MCKNVLTGVRLARLVRARKRRADGPPAGERTPTPAAKLTEVLPVEVENRPGGLARVLDAIEAAGLGVEYMYDFGAASRGGKAAIIFRFEDPDAALAALGAASLRVLTSEEVLAR